MIPSRLLTALAGLLLVGGPVALAYDNADLRRDLQSEDPLVYQEATQKALEMPTPEMVRDLMDLTLSRDPKDRTPRDIGDLLYGSPRQYALLALSRLLPNPPATFSSDFNRGGMRGAEIYFLELWEAWWEEHHQDFEGVEMPARRPDSLRNLSAEDLEARERRDHRKSYDLFSALSRLQASRSGATWDEIEAEYLEERRQARAAARMVAAGKESSQEPAALNGNAPPATGFGSGGEVLSGSWPWIVAASFLALTALVLLTLRLRHRSTENPA